MVTNRTRKEVTDMKCKIKLGCRYKESLLGIEGVATAITDHITGCNRAQIQLVDRKGNKKVYEFDETRLTKVRGSTPEIPHTAAKTSVKLGQIYKDTLTGIKGRAVSIQENIGLTTILVDLEYLDNEGDVKDNTVVESRLELVKAEKPKPAVKKRLDTTRKRGASGHAAVAGTNFSAL
jgi:hypothetical protein